MFYRWMVILVFVSLFSCISCSKMGVAGKYISEKNQNNYIELRSDGTFLSLEGDKGVEGKYEIEGHQILLKTNILGGMILRGKLEGNIIIVKGEKWIKKII